MPKQPSLPTESTPLSPKTTTAAASMMSREHTDDADAGLARSDDGLESGLVAQPKRHPLRGAVILIVAVALACVAYASGFMREQSPHSEEGFVPATAASLLTGPRLSLLVFSAFLALCTLPAWWGVRSDRRLIHGVGVWVKPLKFLAALTVFSLSTALLMTYAGLQADAELHSVSALLIATSAFEAGYIAFQASRAEESHYNQSDALHRGMNIAMALGAIGLTASQAWLAAVITREDSRWASSVATLGAVLGLILTFVFATVSGFMLGGKRAPPGQGELPVVRWHQRADLRPAHFLGVHVQQAVPLFGLLADQLLSRPAAYTVFSILVLLYLLAFVFTVRWQLQRKAAQVTGEAAEALAK